MANLSITAEAPINIAFIKYWGKKNEDLILPLNDSYSITLSTDKFRSITKVTASNDFDKDELILNGKSEDMAKNPRLVNVLKAIRERCAPEYKNLKIKADSTNTFPTAAGMASSASGYCCLVYALSQLFNIEGDISVIARVGSGSACRSVYGGFVKWITGEQEDGSDSIAVQGFPASHWPEVQVFVLVSRASEKETPSTEGMRTSVATSSYLQEHLPLVPDRMKRADEAIGNRDFKTFAEITMEESDDLRKICITSTPPIDYWKGNEYPERVREFIKKYNEVRGETRAAYTFDAGPNAFIFTLKKWATDLMATILHTFPTDAKNLIFVSEGLLEDVERCKPERLLEFGRHEGFVQIMQSPVGSGPIAKRE